MAELQTKKTGASVDAFIAAQPDAAVRADCHTIIRMMSAATGDAPSMWGPAIVGFGHSKLKYASGKEIDWMEVAFSPRKNNLTLYLYGEHEQLLAKLGKHRTSKACLYIKRLADVDTQVLKDLVEASVKAFRKAEKEGRS